MTNPNAAIKQAETLAQNQYLFAILFLLLLGLMLWAGTIILGRLKKDNESMEDKNDAVIAKMEKMHEERQAQLMGFMNDQKADSKEREAQLMTHNNTLLVQLQSQTSSLEEITRTQASMQVTQEKMQDSLGNLQESYEKIEARIEKIEQDKQEKGKQT